MPPLEIVYLAVAPEGYTSLQKARALERLGHRVSVINLYDCLPRNIWWHRANNYSGGRLSQPWVRRFVADRMPPRTFDVAWVDSGQFVGPSVIALLRRRAARVVNYNHDDPTGNRDGRAWNLFRATVPHYDLLATVRQPTADDLVRAGARRVVRVLMSFDELAHRPRRITEADRQQWGSEVVFVGSWMPERGPFMKRLVELGVPLTIIGDHWQKAPELPALRMAWRCAAVYGDDYAKAIQCSRVALGLLSKGNRDLHTTRSTEIPALGGLLCAERTTEHARMFREGEEAVFWADAEECAAQCLALLSDEDRRRRIALAGSEAVRRGAFGNESVLAQILQALETAPSLPTTP